MLLTTLLGSAHAFCGAYVAEEGVEVENRHSTIVMARVGNATTLTMLNDVSGDPASFGLIIPVPSGFDEGNLRLADRDVIEKIEAYTAPRRVSYTCDDFYSGDIDAAISTKAARAKDHVADTGLDTGGSAATSASTSASGCSGSSSGDGSAWFDDEAWQDTGDADDAAVLDTATGTTVEEEFDLGEYTAFVLSAEDGEGLWAWLNDNGFRADVDTAAELAEHVAAGSWFLALKVDLGRAPREGEFLSPLQMGYYAETLGLPIKLGAASSVGVQDLVAIVLAADDEGRWGISNYPGFDAPGAECMVELDPGRSFYDWYEEQFTEAIDIAADPTAVEGAKLGWITEYSWGSGKCDPCTEVGPLEADDAVALGYGDTAWGYRVTRLRLRYTPEGVTQDLALYPTNLQEDTQLRYVEHAWELESLLPICEHRIPDEPGACYSAEWWARQASEGGAQVDTNDYSEGCDDPLDEPVGRTLLLLPFLAAWGLRRKFR